MSLASLAHTPHPAHYPAPLGLPASSRVSPSGFALEIRSIRGGPRPLPTPQYPQPHPPPTPPRRGSAVCACAHAPGWGGGARSPRSLRGGPLDTARLWLALPGAWTGVASAAAAVSCTQTPRVRLCARLCAVRGDVALLLTRVSASPARGCVGVGVHEWGASRAPVSVG